MKILHIQGIFSPEHGGPTQSLTQYCVGQARRRHTVSAWVLEGFPHTSPAIRLPAPVQTIVYPIDFPAPLGRSRAMRRALAATANPDVFHLHGAWLRAMHYGAEEARRRRIPYLVEPMGMYESYGLKTKWMRKKLARCWFQDAILEGAHCLQVNSRREGEQLRRLGFRSPLAVIPVGVDLSACDVASRTMEQKPSWVNFAETRWFLFLSRIHEKKGIELLLHAWAALASKCLDWKLVIGGSGTPDYIRSCQQLATTLGLADRCVWLGHLSEGDKGWAFAHADFFILPSFSENLGNVITEALAYGTPVLTTDETPWQDVRTRKCGWIASPTTESLTEVLDEALRTTPEQLETMGARGRRWCEEEFSLDRVLENLDAVYAWMLGNSPKPDCVTES